MTEDLVKSLQTYRIQLEEVEAALTSDPNNDELVKLHNDLTEVIALTGNLLQVQNESSLSAASTASNNVSLKKWRIGDKCQAVLSDDGKWYNASIDAITEDGMVALTFDLVGSSDVTQLGLIREYKADRLAPSTSTSSNSEKSKKKVTEQQRQAAKKKKLTRFDRQKKIDEAHEQDKAKWQAFNLKAVKTKKFRGLTRKSIFATPEAATGRVGIGTCGIGGKPMTEFTHAEKWRKGT